MRKKEDPDFIKMKEEYQESQGRAKRGLASYEKWEFKQFKEQHKDLYKKIVQELKMNDAEIKHLIKLNYKLSNTVAKKTKRSNIYKNATKTLESENEVIWTMID